MSKLPLFALIDCNNFFVSCERIFRPDLEGKPVVVLSSNDGCAVARSNEAKALGIPMGAPAFKYKELFRRHNVVKFSANFELYGDISRRITEIITTITPRTEIYSIDELFLDISELNLSDQVKWAQAIRQKILSWVGVPVSIGIAPSKTSAKLASEYAKKHVADNITVLDSSDHSVFSSVPVEDVWGVGRRMGLRLRSRGIANAEDLRDLSPQQGRSIFNSVSGEKLVRELNGQSCLPLELQGKPQKMISASRTFGEDTDQFNVIEAAMVSFAARVGVRLRDQNLLAKHLSIFAETNKHKDNFYRWNKDMKLSMPSADTGLFAEVSVDLLKSIYSQASGREFHRAGILLSNLQSTKTLQLDSLGQINPTLHDKSTARMQSIDSLNEKFGKRTVHFAGEDLAASWQPKRILKSPAYTTDSSGFPACRII